MKNFFKNHLDLVLYLQIAISILLILFSFLTIFFSDLRIGLVAGLILPFNIVNMICLFIVCFWCIYLKNFSWQNISSIVFIGIIAITFLVAMILSFTSIKSIYGVGLLLMIIINIITFFYSTVYFKTNRDILFTMSVYEINQ